MHFSAVWGIKNNNTLGFLPVKQWTMATKLLRVWRWSVCATTEPAEVEKSWWWHTEVPPTGNTLLLLSNVNRLILIFFPVYFLSCSPKSDWTRNYGLSGPITVLDASSQRVVRIFWRCTSGRWRCFCFFSWVCYMLADFTIFSTFFFSFWVKSFSRFTSSPQRFGWSTKIKPPMFSQENVSQLSVI